MDVISVSHKLLIKNIKKIYYTLSSKALSKALNLLSQLPRFLPSLTIVSQVLHAHRRGGGFRDTLFSQNTLLWRNIKWLAWECLMITQENLKDVAVDKDERKCADVQKMAKWTIHQTITIIV